MATSPSSGSNVWVFPIGSACFLEDVIPSFPYHPTFWDLSSSGNPLVSWCGPYRQGCPPLLSLWPESTLLCVSAQSQVWQRLLDVEGTSCCIAVWHLTPGHSPPQPSHSPIYFCGDMKRGLTGGCAIGTSVILGYFQMSTWGSSHPVVVLNPDSVFWQCILKFYFMSNWMIFHPFSPSKGCNIC